MAAAIFFVSGGPLVWGPSLFFVPPQGVGVFGGATQKSQGIFVVQCLNHTMH